MTLSGTVLGRKLGRRLVSKIQWPRLARYGPWAIVTGASDGIGQEVARGLTARGMHIVLVARRRDALDALSSELSDKHRVETRVLVADLASRDAVNELEPSTRDLDVGLLVASAGFGTSGDLIDGHVEHELEMVDVNCRAVLGLCHAFGRRFAARGRGGLMLMSSIVAFQGVPRASAYAATKAFVQSLAEGLHLELAPRGVDVLAVAPGPVHSGFAERANMRLGTALRARDIADGAISALGRRMTTRPGWLSKLLAFALVTAPRALRVRIMAGVMGSFTRHQRLVGSNAVLGGGGSR